MSFDALRNNIIIVGRASVEDAENSLKRHGYSEDDFAVSVTDDT